MIRADPKTLHPPRFRRLDQRQTTRWCSGRRVSPLPAGARVGLRSPWFALFRSGHSGRTRRHRLLNDRIEESGIDTETRRNVRSPLGTGHQRRPVRSCCPSGDGRVPPVTTLARAAAVLRIAGIPYPCGRAVRTERSPRCIEAPKHRMTCFHKSAGDKLSRPLPRDPTLFCRHPYP